MRYDKHTELKFKRCANEYCRAVIYDYHLGYKYRKFCSEDCELEYQHMKMLGNIKIKEETPRKEFYPHRELPVMLVI